MQRAETPNAQRSTLNAQCWQDCGGGLQKIFHVTFYDVGEFFDGQCDHIQIARAGDVLDSKKQSKK